MSVCVCVCVKCAAVHTNKCIWGKIYKCRILISLNYYIYIYVGEYASCVHHKHSAREKRPRAETARHTHALCEKTIKNIFVVRFLIQIYLFDWLFPSFIPSDTITSNPTHPQFSNINNMCYQNVDYFFFMTMIVCHWSTFIFVCPLCGLRRIEKYNPWKRATLKRSVFCCCYITVFHWFFCVFVFILINALTTT